MFRENTPSCAVRSSTHLAVQRIGGRHAGHTFAHSFRCHSGKPYDPLYPPVSAPLSLYDNFNPLRHRAAYDESSGIKGGNVTASVFSVSQKLSPEIAVSFRAGVVRNSPASGESATSITNPLFAALYSTPISENLRLGFFLGVTAPVGSGGGNSPDAAVRSANSAAILGRSAMDNALFAANYFTMIPGAGLAFVANAWTLQAEMTVLRLTRVRGKSIDKDPTRTNLTSGIALGYAFTSSTSLITELHYQRWLDNATVQAAPNPAIENISFMIGPRFTIKSGNATLRPGVGYGQGLSGAIARSGYTYPTNRDRIVFLDLPISF